MHGIVTLLDEVNTINVQSLWQKLENECGLSGIKVTPIPHFSWQVAEDYELQSLEPFLRKIAQDTQPFTVHTTGLGLFTGDRPVVFIPLVKDAQMLRFHEMMWEQAKTSAHGINQLYSPASWIPHITLAHGDVDPHKLTCAMENIAFQTFDWEIIVDNLALIGQDEDDTGREVLRVRFKG